MKLLHRLLGWKKLIRANILFKGDFLHDFGSTDVTVQVVEYHPSIPRLEYVRLWLQYLAYTSALWVQYGHLDVSYRFCNDLFDFSKSNFVSDTEILPSFTGNQRYAYKRYIAAPEFQIQSHYYVKKSTFRLIDLDDTPTLSKGDITLDFLLWISILALLQYTIDENNEDEPSLATLRNCCRLWPDYFGALTEVSPDAIAILPNAVYVEAVATSSI